MKVAVFSTHDYDRQSLNEANAGAGHELVFFEVGLDTHTTKLAHDFPAVCLFVNDNADAEVLESLSEAGVRLIVLRSAGFNNVDLEAADRLGMTVLRVPAYSPHAVAEHTLALILTLNRKIHRAFNRVREQNFSLEGLMGFDLQGKTAGVVGTGKIGTVVARILLGFGCDVIALDPYQNDECIGMGVVYTSLDDLLNRSDIITLHCPLTPETRHLIGAGEVAKMRQGVMLVNTSRGAVIDTCAVIDGLKSRRIGSLALDVYEEEGDLFFRDLSEQIITDDVFARLMTFPNVLITAHQAFFTREAVANIAETTIRNVSDFERSKVREAHRVTARHIAG